MATGVPKTKWNGTLHSDKNLSMNASDVYLTFEGKINESDILNTKPSNIKVLWQDDLEYKDGNDNQLYFGNNLPILASLLKDSSIKGKVRLIYIDPPFSTKSVFQSRSQKDAYCDLLTGAQYIEFIRERLVLLRELLAEDGSIYVHLGGNMASYVKVIMDEIFGKGNFRNWITRKKCNPKNYTRKVYGSISDHILFYTKSDDYVWNRPYKKWTPEHAKKEYQYIEEGTGRRYKKVPIHAPGVRNGETGKHWQGMSPPPGKHWQFLPKTLDEMDARGEIYWSPSGNPRRKIYLDESKGVPVQDIWLDFRDAHNQNIKISGYPTEKNPDLLARIIEASSNAGDIVLDCFSGSGTTLDVASQLNRRWIGIDDSREAIVATLRRFALGLERMGDYVNKREIPNKKRQVQTSPPSSDLTKYFNQDAPKSLKLGIIKNFSVYTTESYAGELEDILHTATD